MKKISKEEKRIKGYKAKKAGTSFEYRVRNVINNLPGWVAERNILSGGADQISKNIAKHDVRAYNKELNIFLQIECKKTTGINKEISNQIYIKNDWISKINFHNDELLCFAFDRSEIYTLIIYDEKYIENFKDIKYYKCTSKDSFKITEDDLIKSEINILEWNNNKYIIMKLINFIKIRELIELRKNDTIEDKIKKIKTIEDFKKFEKDNFNKLTIQQKKLLYTIACNIIENKTQEVEDLVVKCNKTKKTIIDCPHCGKLITTEDIKNKLNTEIMGVDYEIF